jgi:hypothetical protein
VERIGCEQSRGAFLRVPRLLEALPSRSGALEGIGPVLVLEHDLYGITYKPGGQIVSEAKKLHPSTDHGCFEYY